MTLSFFNPRKGCESAIGVLDSGLGSSGLLQVRNFVPSTENGKYKDD